MLPVRPFTCVCWCDRHREDTEHEMFFMEYNPANHQVTYQAICILCDLELSEDRDVVGFVASMDVKQWDEITPIEDEFVFS